MRKENVIGTENTWSKDVEFGCTSLGCDKKSKCCKKYKKKAVHCKKCPKI